MKAALLLGLLGVGLGLVLLLTLGKAPSESFDERYTQTEERLEAMAQAIDEDVSRSDSQDRPQ